MLTWSECCFSSSTPCEAATFLPWSAHAHTVHSSGHKAGPRASPWFLEGTSSATCLLSRTVTYDGTNKKPMHKDMHKRVCVCLPLCVCHVRVHVHYKIVHSFSWQAYTEANLAEVSRLCLSSLSSSWPQDTLLHWQGSGCHLHTHTHRSGAVALLLHIKSLASEKFNECPYFLAHY